MTSPPSFPSPVDVDIVAATAGRLIEDFGWTAVTSAELVDGVRAARAAADPSVSDETLVYRCYQRLLYAACRQATDGAKRKRAFVDLHRYLYLKAWRKWSYLGEDPLTDVAQAALEQVFRRLDDVEEPDAFHTFAYDQMRAARQTYLRAEARQRNVRAAVKSDHAGGSFDRLGDAAVHGCFEQLMRIAEDLNAEERRLLTCKHLEMGDEDAGKMLGGIAANAVRQRWHRLREKLRKYPDLRKCFDAIDGDDPHHDA